MKIVNLILLLLFFSNTFGQAPSIQWAKSFGGYHDDKSYSIIQTSDGGYIAVGVSESDDGQVVGMHNSLGVSEDIWLIKLDSLGNMIWQKCLGGSIGEGAMSINATNDSGFIIAGYASSTDGDVIGGHFLDNDYWIIKTDSLGNIQWQKVLGSSHVDLALDAKQSSDGGYIVCGNVSDGDRDVFNFHGSEDYWVVKLTQVGNVQWARALGGYSYDLGEGINETPDNGYIVVGGTVSNDSNVIGNHGGSDAWIVKLDSTGNEQWNKCYGGSGDDGSQKAQVLLNGDIVIAGATSSNDGNVSGSFGGPDFWVYKINSAGILKWSKCYGDIGFEAAHDISLTSDSGFVILGRTASWAGMATGNHGIDDVFVVKIDSSGNYEWSKCLGGSNVEDGFSIKPTRDGGYIISGETKSNDGDVSGSHGTSYYDYWVVKLAPIGLTIPEESLIRDFSSYLNSTTNMLNISFYSSTNCNITLQLMDLTGRLLFEKFLSVGNGINKTIAYAGNISEGIYMLRLVNPEVTISRKIVKE